MSPEEFQRLKEAEKAHLRKLRALKEAVREQQRTRRVSDALGAVVDGRAALDAQDEAVERLAFETARSEARLDLALEAADEKAREAEREAENEEVLQAARARDLVARMKAELAAGGARTQPDAPDEAAPPKADKTVGKSAPARDADEDAETAAPGERPGEAAPFPEEGLPEKTIGRMRRG